jgi:predicted MPP superfamily phosphohydrolase
MVVASISKGVFKMEWLKRWAGKSHRLLTLKLTWRSGLLTVGILLLVSVSWMAFEARWLKVRIERVTVAAWTGKQPLRVVELADFHVEHLPYRHLERAVDLALAQQPDVVLLAGDYTMKELPEPKAEFGRIMRKLAAAVPTFAVYGNHDHAYAFVWEQPITNPPVGPALQEAGITVLRNQSRTITVRGQPVEIDGLGEFWVGDASPLECLKKKRTGSGPILVIAHNPDTKDGAMQTLDWDVLFSGHTHGGQIVSPIPGLKPRTSCADNDRIHGIYDLGNHHTLVVTAGIGCLHGLRFNCRPEVMVIDIVAGATGNGKLKVENGK